MYIVLDSTVLTADKQFSNSFWRLIGSRPERWGLKVALPWTVAQEAVANRRRDLEATLGAVNTVLSNVARQGIEVATTPEVVEELQRAIDEYEEWFTKKLDDLRIEVLPLPADFGHAEAVLRAVQRRRPCNDKGDGYRDTLNWISVVSLVEHHPDETVVWVSNDSDFYASREQLVLHQDLVEDLDELGATERVVSCLDAAGTRELLIEEHQLDSDTGEWSALELRVAELVATALTEQQRILDPVECGLPLAIRTAHALLESASATGPAEVTDLEADSPAQARDLPFTVRFDARCRMVQYSRADGKATFGLTDDGPLEVVAKHLVASGTVHFDGHTHHPSDILIDEVTGVPGDPDVLRNRETRRRQLVQNLIAGSLRNLPETRTAELLAAAMGPQPLFGKLVADQLGMSDTSELLAAAMGPQSAFGKLDSAELLAAAMGPQSAFGKLDSAELLAAAMGPQSAFGKLDSAELLAAAMGPQSAFGKLDSAELLAAAMGPQTSFGKLVADQVGKLDSAELLAAAMGPQTSFGKLVGEQLDGPIPSAKDEEPEQSTDDER